jgi:single-strand DNA-binding protein
MSFFSFDQIIIAGKAARPAEMRYTASGQAVTKFSIPVDRSYKDNSGEWVKRTIWYNVSAWGKMAEQCNQRVEKGTAVMVRGTLEHDDNGSPRIWTAQDGTAKSSFEVRADNFGGVTFLSDAQMIDQAGAGGAPDDEVPF